MSTLHRFMLEVGSGVAVVSILGCSVIPLPEDVLMDHYVHWFRLLLSLVATFGGGCQLLQTSEPLPSWAMFTKLTSSSLLVFCGTVSYGVYLVHWVLIVWLGDSDINTVHSMSTWQGRQSGFGPLARDVGIGIVSIIISAASFCLLEKPLVQRSAKARASHVIASGMVSMGCVAMLVFVATAGCVDPNPTLAELPGANMLSDERGLIPRRMLFLGDSQAYRLAQVIRFDYAKDKSVCADSYAEPWGPYIINRAEPGTGVVQEFGSERCSLCMQQHVGGTSAKEIFETKKHAKALVETVEKEHAPYVFVMDSHFFRGWKDVDKDEAGLWGMEEPLLEALKRTITYLAWNGALHIFLSTCSPFARFQRGAIKDDQNDLTVNGAILQSRMYHEGVMRMRCPSSADASQRVLVSVVDFHKLICPSFNESEKAPTANFSYCNQSGPGFTAKMDDGVHVNFGPGGWHVVHQLQEVLYSGIARQGTHFTELFEGITGCHKRRYPDHHLNSLTDLVSTTEVCVHRQARPARVHDIVLQHQSVKIELLSGEKDVYMCRGIKFKKKATPRGTGITSLSVAKVNETWHRIHHVALYSCKPSFNASADFEKSFPCTGFPNDACSRMIYVFGPGEEEFALPDGFSLPIQTEYAMLAVHYKRSGAKGYDTFLDSTGIRIKFDRFLNSVQLFELGPRSPQMLAIPPKRRRHVVQSICAPECLSAAMDGIGAKEFRIIGLHQHMHLAGIAMKSEVLHPNGSSTPFGVFPRYNGSDHETNKMKLLSSDVVVSRGDALKVTCVYDSSQRARWTILGASFADEMCLSYILMTPAPLFLNSCWHSGAVSTPTSVGESQADCDSECGKSFTVQPTQRLQGPEAAVAQNDVFRATEACLSGGA
jgi:hypothetical protein